MPPITERIASLSLPAVLLFLVIVTCFRAAFYATRIPLLRMVGDLLESVLVAVTLVFLVLRPFVLQSYFIPSGSMRPTLRQGNHILVNKWVYRCQPPQRGEVVVFRAPRSASYGEKEFIKRLIGMPGDTIEVKEGYVTLGRDTYTRFEILSLLERTFGKRSQHGEHYPLRLTAEAIWYGDRRLLPEVFAEIAGKRGRPVTIQPGRVLLNGRALMECYTLEDAHYRLTPRVVPPGHYFVLGATRNRSDDSHTWGTLPAERLIGRAEFVFWPLSDLRRLGPE